MNKPLEASNGKKSRSPIERLIVWGIIGIALGIVFIEFRAQKGYTATMEALSNTYDSATKRLPLTEVEALMSGGPSKSVKLEDDSKNHYVYSWFSIFKGKDYVLNVITTKDTVPAMTRFYEGPGADPMAPVAPANPAPPGGLSLGMRRGGDNSKEEPAKEEPAKEEPAKEEPAKEEPAKEEPAKEEPAKEEPKA